MPPSPKSRAEIYEEKLDVHGFELAFNDDGVDLTQIRHALEMTPLERLAWVDQAAAEIELLRRRVRPPSGSDANA